MQLTPIQQREFAKRMNDELDKVIMSWDNEVKEWYPIAIKSLRFASSLDLNIPQHRFSDLFEMEPQGLNMNVVAILINSVEARTPAEMDEDPIEWGKILLLNHKMFEKWLNLRAPIEKKVAREFEIMLNRPKMVGV